MKIRVESENEMISRRWEPAKCSEFLGMVSISYHCILRIEVLGQNLVPQRRYHFSSFFL